MKRFSIYKPAILLMALFGLTVSTTQAQTARVQVIHNSPDDVADSVDVYLNGTMLIDNFAFRNASPFIDAPAGTPLQIDIAPKNSTGVGQSIANFPVTLTANETYVVVADGITGLSSTTYNPAPAFDLKIYAMGQETSAQVGNTDVLVHHGSTDAPTVDVFETSVPAGTIVNDAPYGAFSGYLELATADYVLAVQDSTGSLNVASFDAPLLSLGLDDGAAVVVASGFLNPGMNGNGPAFGLYVALPSGGEMVALPQSEARVQVIHNSPDDAATAVDVYLNGDLLLDDFAFRTASPFVTAPAGVEIEIDIAPSNSMDVSASIANFPLTLASGETYVVVADGITGLSSTMYNPAPPFGLEIYSMGREMAAQSGNTDVLVHHGSTDAPTVDVFESSVPAGTIVDDIPYAGFDGYLELATADYILDIQDMTGMTTVASYQAPLQTLSLQGEAITVVASGFLDPSMNGYGPSFGLFVALAAGGPLVELPISVGMEEQEAINVGIYPNPAVDVINLTTQDLAIVQVDVVDMNGRVVLSEQNPIAGISIDKLVPGVYSLMIVTDNGSTTKRFMKL